jgi:group I intron endonuclease
MIGIYKVTSPTNKVYIGQSVDIEKRWKDHKNCYEGYLLQNSLKKHGFENHTFEILEECSAELLNERERFYQDFYDVLGPNGLNCRLTETSDKTGELSSETKKKIGISNKNVVLTEEIKVRKLQRFKNTISSKTEEEKLITRNKRSKANKTVWTDEMRQKRKLTIESKGIDSELERRSKISKTQQDRTEEEKDLLRKKNSDGLIEYHKNKTEEEKLIIGSKISKALKDRPVSLETRLKISNTLKERNKSKRQQNES